MESFKFHDIRSEKANAISRHRGKRRITTLFRFIELFIFLIVLSRFSTQFAFSLNILTTAEYFRGIQVTLISPRFVFLVGNAIVIVLVFISGQFSTKNGKKSDGFYDEYMKKCRSNNPRKIGKEEKVKASGPCRLSVGPEERKMSRCKSENLEREESRRDLRRSMSEKCRGSGGCGRKAAAAGGGSAYAEDEMSSEEFRRTVEAFIARQQRFLREEEEGFSAVVSV